MSISFSGTLTEQDFYRFQQLGTPAFYRWFFRWSACLGWFFLGFSLILVFQGFSPIDSLFFPSLLLFYFLWLPKQRERQLKQLWESNKLIQGEISGEVDREAIVWNETYLNATAYSNTKCPWEILLHYQEQADLVLIYTGINQVFMLERSFFQSEEDWQQFRQLVAEKLPNKAKKNSKSRSR